MEIICETHGELTNVTDEKTGEYLGGIWEESNGLFVTDGFTFTLLADAIEHISTLLPNKVRAGALALDKLMPGWAEMVDTETLNMDNVVNCIVGQVFEVAWPAEYMAAAMRLGGREKMHDYGFEDDWTRWGTLKHLWIDEIDRRKKF